MICTGPGPSFKGQAVLGAAVVWPMRCHGGCAQPHTYAPSIHASAGGRGSAARGSVASSSGSYQRDAVRPGSGGRSKGSSALSKEDAKQAALAAQANAQASKVGLGAGLCSRRG